MFPDHHDAFDDLLPEDTTQPVDPEKENAALAAAQEAERAAQADTGAGDVALGAALTVDDVRLLCRVHAAFFGAGGKVGVDAAADASVLADLDTARRLHTQRSAVRCLAPYLRSVGTACIDVGTGATYVASPTPLGTSYCGLWGRHPHVHTVAFPGSRAARSLCW